tara:strand:+ start:196 stop:333 length:138 start_codon:yes stop_codon:yes gene_type:complete
MRKMIALLKYMYESYRQFNSLWERYLAKKHEAEKHNSYVRKIRGV